MKKIYLFLAVPVLLSMSSCSRGLEEENSFDGVSYKIESLSATQASESKTSITEEGSVLWNINENIKVFCQDKSAKFTSTNTSSSATATFQGELTVPSKKSIIYGLYPYKENAQFDGTYITTSLSQFQTGVAGTFPDSLSIAMCKAVAEDGTLNFKNCCGGIRFKLSRSGIKKIILRGNNDETLAGTAIFSFDLDGNPIVHSVTSPKQEIILTANNTFETGKWYFILTLPVKFTSGFTMTFKTASQKAVKTVDVEKTISRSGFLSSQNIDDGLNWDDLGNAINLQLVHSKLVYTLPTFTNGTGYVDWGDGTEKEYYSEGLSHTYTNEGVKEVTVETSGATTFKLESVDNISDISITYHKKNK